MPIRLYTEADTAKAGALLATELRTGDFVGLVGELGAGKTCLVRGLIDAITHGQGDQVSSPTFTLINRYDVGGELGEVAHVDLYRLENADDLESTGYWDVVAEAGVTIVEWLDRIPEALPESGFILTLAHDGDGRTLEVTWRGPGGAASAERLAALQDSLRTLE